MKVLRNSSSESERGGGTNQNPHWRARLSPALSFIKRLYPVTRKGFALGFGKRERQGNVFVRRGDGLMEKEGEERR